jgi:hypothetical protein
MDQRQICWSCRELNTGLPARSPSLCRLSYPAPGHHPELYETNSHPHIPVRLRFALILSYSLRWVSHLVPFLQILDEIFVSTFLSPFVSTLPAFHGTQGVFTLFTITHLWVLPSGTWIQCTFSHFISLRSILTLSYNLVSFPSSLSPLGYPTRLLSVYHPFLCQYLFRFLRNQNIHYREYKRRPLDPILRHMNPACIIASF